VRRVLWGIAVLASAACGTGAALPPPDARETLASADAAPAPDAAMPPLVLTAGFTLPSGKETWLCLRKTVTQTVYVKAFETAGSPGVHHTLLAVEDALTRDDGVTTCGPALDAHRVLFSAGRNTPRLDLPPGVAFEIRRGERFLVHLHLFNATESSITGSAGFRLARAAAEEVRERADMILAGDVELAIPPGESTHVGTCRIRSDATLVAIGPHMHRLGVHQRVSIERGGIGETLLDQPFDLDEQPYTLMTTALTDGDVVHVACTYLNDTGAMVYFGGSSNDEMCYARLLFYPPSVHSPVCVR
jgi:hypothetical protein